MRSKPTILVVDEEASIRSGLIETISRHGFNVVAVENGRAGYDKAKEVMPDLVLSDVFTAAPDGFEMRREMSADPKLASIPFIFLTANPPVEAPRSGLPEGVDDFVTKPFASEELISHIESVLHRLNSGRADRLEQDRAMAQEQIDQFRTLLVQNYRDQLRGPFGNVVMSLEMAISHNFEDPREQAAYVRSAISDPDRLDGLVSDMALLADIDQNDLDRRRQSIDVEEHIMEPLRARLERYGVKHLDFVQDIRLKGEIMAPRREFTQALVRVADNAFKYSPVSGRVELFVSSRPHGGATIFFQDEGPGIAKELREKVFGHFFQAVNGQRAEERGLGVGLTIARAVFASLGGDVRIGDSLQGCRVEAFLPDMGSADISQR